MNTALWIVAGILALAFVGAGAMKLSTPKEKLLENMAWAEDFSQAQIRGIGLAELLGGIGLILPPLVDVAPVLAPIAAAGLAVTMVGAVAVHLKRRDGVADWSAAVVLGAMAVFVAVMRFGSEAF